MAGKNEDLLIDLNDSAKNPSMAGVHALIDPKLAAREEESLLALSDFLGYTPRRTCIPSSNEEEKSSLCLDPVNLSPFGCPLKESAQCFKLDVITTSNQTGFSPLSCSKESNTKHCNSLALPNCEVSNLISPFGSPVKTAVSDTEVCLENKVTAGELLLMQEEIKMPDDMFDLAVLTKKQSNADTAVDGACFNKTNPLWCDNADKFLFLSIPSIGSSGSNVSSDGTINKAFIELSNKTERNDLFPTADDSVFEEAQALSEEFSKLSVYAPSSPLEGIENEDGNIVYDCPDLDDIDTENIEIRPDRDEIKRLLDLYSKENECKDNLEAINENSSRCSNNSVLSVDLGTSMCNGTPVSISSSSSISPPPLSTHRIDHMRLKANEVIGAPLNFGPLKVNVSSRTSVLPAKTGPMKAFLPVGKMVKNKLSSTTTTTICTTAKSKGTPRLTVTDSSPPFTKERCSVARVMSSTPKILKPCIPSATDSASRKGVIGNFQKSFSSSKVHPNGISTPTRPRTSSFGRGHELEKTNPNTKVTAVSGIKKLLGPSQAPNKRYSSNSQVTKPASVVRSNSAGHLPLTPSLKKVDSSTHLTGFQSPLKRSISMSTKLSMASPPQPLATNYMNSPAKQSTPLKKLMLKFRRNSVSKGMKENISPV